MADVPYGEPGDAQEAAEPRKMYGTSPTPDFGSMLSSAGDPIFETDAQNNDEFFRNAADRADELGNEIEAD